jgi:hypothetical protein
MHPVGYLFEDIYRNYWGITPVSDRPEPRRLTKPALRSRELFFRSERRQD